MQTEIPVNGRRVNGNEALLLKDFLDQLNKRHQNGTEVDSPNAKKMRLTSDINVENIKPSQSVELTKNDINVVSDVANSLKSLSENFRNEVSKQEALPYPINSKQFSVYPMASFVEKGRTDLMSNVPISITCQPSNFQIANYNIHPAPILTFDSPLPINQTVHAHLLDASSYTIINGGFQTGDVRVLRSGNVTLYFTGLKINKMGPIKHELQMKHAKQSGAEFCIQFTIGTRIICSDKFKLVSSCSQLPEDLKNMVRPSKKGRPSNSHDHSRTPSPLNSSDVSIKSDSLSEGKKLHHCYTKAVLGQIANLRKELDQFIQNGDVEGAMETAKLLAHLHKQNKS